MDPLEGFVMRWVANNSGGYWDFSDFSLQNAENEDFDNFPIPDPDNLAYDAALENCRNNREQLALYIGHPGVGDIIHTNGRMMGMEDALCHLQPDATNMSPRYLAETFGSKLRYRGCISTVGPLAYGTAEEVVAQVKDTLAVMMPLGGYHFAPTHRIQDNSPTENVIALYQAAHDFGRHI